MLWNRNPGLRDSAYPGLQCISSYSGGRSRVPVLHYDRRWADYQIFIIKIPCLITKGGTKNLLDINLIVNQDLYPSKLDGYTSRN